MQSYPRCGGHCSRLCVDAIPAPLDASRAVDAKRWQTALGESSGALCIPVLLSGLVLWPFWRRSLVRVTPCRQPPWWLSRVQGLREFPGPGPLPAQNLQFKACSDALYWVLVALRCRAEGGVMSIMAKRAFSKETCRFGCRWSLLVPVCLGALGSSVMSLEPLVPVVVGLHRWSLWFRCLFVACIFPCSLRLARH